MIKFENYRDVYTLAKFGFVEKITKDNFQIMCLKIK